MKRLSIVLPFLALGVALVVGVLLPIFAFAESNWSAVFFFFAVSGLVSIGVMGASGNREPVRQRITPGE